MNQFHIGQKVVCVDVSGRNGKFPNLIKDKIYTVHAKGLVHCEEESLDVGTTNESGWVICCCGKMFYKGSRALYNAARFVPLEEYTANEVAVNELMKPELIESK